jgi:hypothetical protein
VNRCAVHFRTTVCPRHEHARAEYMHSGHVCMTVGCKLHELVSRPGSSVIPDTAPKAALATPTGLNADLHAGCHDDVHGNQLATVEDRIRRAFVQDKKAHACSVPKRTDTELNCAEQSTQTQPSPTK